MKHEEIFLEEVDASVNSRISLNEVHHPQFNKLKKLFNFAFNNKIINFKYLNDLIYYKGGYPKENSKPKLSKLLDDIGGAFKFFKFIGKEDEINSYLFSNFGINIVDTNNSDTMLTSEIIKFDKFCKIWKSAFDEDYNKNMSKKDILLKFIDYGQKIQSTICVISDSIKIDSANKVEAECEVKKKTFIPIVNLKSKYVANGDSKVIDKIYEINKSNDSFNEGIEKSMPEINKVFNK